MYRDASSRAHLFVEDLPRGEFCPDENEEEGAECDDSDAAELRGRGDAEGEGESAFQDEEEGHESARTSDSSMRGSFASAAPALAR